MTSTTTDHTNDGIDTDDLDGIDDIDRTTGTSTAGPVIDDSTFDDLVGALDLDLDRDLDLDLGRIDAWQRRAVEWARFADRLRSHGHRISVGGRA